MASPILRIAQLTLRAGTRAIVSDLSLEVMPGEIIALTGRSGSGKTSLAMAILGMLPPGLTIESGTISWQPADQPAMRWPDDQALWPALRGAGIGFIQQDVYGAFDPVMPIGKQLVALAKERVPQTPPSALEAQIRRTMEELGLLDLDRIWPAYPHQLSGGQLQRCLICLSVVMGPALLISDEPTSAMDKIHQWEILKLFRQVRDRYGMAILCITHERALVRQLADREVALDTLMTAEPGVDTGRATRLAGSPVLEATDLTFTYRDGRFGQRTGATIGPISFSLQPGRCLGIIGMSASGKSTLAQLLVGWFPPDQGAIRWRGVPVDIRSSHAVRQLRGHVQLVLQDGRGSLHPHKTIRQLLAETGALRGKSESKQPGIWDEALREVGLQADVLDRRPASLSGGECLRVNIARALILEPDVLICDESTSALDADSRNGVLRLLRSLMELRGLALICITHDDMVVRILADEVLVLSGGRIVEKGPVSEVAGAPTHEISKKIFLPAATF